jgi:hypothetical protein
VRRRKVSAAAFRRVDGRAAASWTGGDASGPHRDGHWHGARLPSSATWPTSWASRAVLRESLRNPVAGLPEARGRGASWWTPGRRSQPAPHRRQLRRNRSAILTSWSCGRPSRARRCGAARTTAEKPLATLPATSREAAARGGAAGRRRDIDAEFHVRLASTPTGRCARSRRRSSCARATRHTRPTGERLAGARCASTGRSSGAPRATGTGRPTCCSAPPVPVRPAHQLL